MKPMVIAVGFHFIQVWAWFSESWSASYCVSKTCFSSFISTCCLLKPNITMTSSLFILPNVSLWHVFFFYWCFENLWPRKEVLERDRLKHFRVYMQGKWLWAARSSSCSFHCFHLTGSVCWELAVIHPDSSPLQPETILSRVWWSALLPSAHTEISCLRCWGEDMHHLKRWCVAVPCW